MSMVEKYATDANALSIIFSSLVLVCKIFRSLNSQVNISIKVIYLTF
jgi:hypothetical protein